MTALNDLFYATRQLSSRLDRDRVIDEICRQFEAAWPSEEALCIEACLAAVDPQVRDELLFELVAVEIELRQSDGHLATRDEYLARFPEDEPIVTAAFEDVFRVDGFEPPRVAEPLPERFGEFRIVREIGRGGMGVVYEAEQESLQRRVALKSLLGQYDSRSPIESRQRFRREARAIARLHHSNIVDVFGDGEHNGVPYFAMRLIDGSGLDQLIASMRSMSDSLSANASRDQSTAKQDAIDTDGRWQRFGAAESDRQKSQRSHAGEAGVRTETGTSDPVADSSAEKSASGADWQTSASSPREGAGQGEDGSSGENVRSEQTEPRLPRTLAERAVLVAKTGRSIASALQYAHDCGVLHRDVKPSNVLLDRTGTAWLTDFGLARLSESETLAGLTLDGSIMGTLRYLPPESLAGTVDERGDQYSLGLVLFELLALRPAYDRVDRAGLLHNIEQCARPNLDEIAPDTPRDLVTIIHKAIDREPSARYATVGELGDDLQRFLNDEPISARRISKLEQFSRWRRRNRGLAASLSTVAILLIVVAVGSAIAAGYFQSMTTALEDTVGNLTTKTNELRALTGELTVARNRAQQSANENLKLAQAAERAREIAVEAEQLSQTTLADMQTERGFLAADEGDAATAMLWFARAATQTPHDPSRQQANRLRARNWMEQSYLPVALLENPGLERRLEFHPDEELLLSVGNGRAFVWEWQAERQLEWSREIDGVADACWLPDGRLAIGLAAGELQIRAIPSGEIVQRIDTGQKLEIVRCSLDGGWLAIGGSMFQIRRRAENGEYVFDREWTHPRPVVAMRFSHAGDRIATVCEDNTARVLDLSDDRVEPAFGPVPHRAVPYSHLPAVPPLFVERDDLLTISAGRLLQCYDLATGNELPIDPPLPTVLGLTASADGQQVAVRTMHGCTIWSPDSRTWLKTGHEVLSAEFSPDGSTLMATSINSKTMLWSTIQTKTIDTEIPHSDIQTFCTSSRRGLLATGNDDSIRVWKRPTESRRRIELPGWNRLYTRPRLGPAGRLVTLGRDHDAPAQPIMEQLTVLDSSTGRAAGPTISAGEMIDSCLLQDSRSVAVLIRSGNEGMLSVFDVATGRKHSTISLPAAPQSISPRPGSPTVAVLCQDGSLRVADPHTGEQQLELQHGDWDWQRAARRHSSLLPPPRVLYTPDGATLICLTLANEIVVRDADSGTMRFPPIQLQTPGGHCRSVDVSRDGRRLATGVTGIRPYLQVWDLATGEPLCAPIFHSGEFWSIVNVRFSPDGDRVLTTHVDGRARLWDIATGELACPPMHHPTEIRGGDLTQDGRHCVTVCNDGAVRLWELQTGKRVAPAARYATDYRDWSETVASVVIQEDLAFVTAPDYPVLDLSSWLRDPESTTPSLEQIATLATSRRIAQGELTPLTSLEWREQWAALRVKPGSPVSDAE